MKTKLFAMYLPQFHEIPENSMFWGKGFTDWVSVKKSTPLFKNHIQPKVPYNDNYYDLSNYEDIKWQVSIAKKYGIDGFGIYHYWFNNDKNLLTKPAEIILESSDLDINYFFAWDNASWKRTWSKFEGNDWAPLQDNQQSNSTNNTLLVEYILGNEKDWENHFNYLLKFFKDDRYEKKDNCRIFVIYNYSEEIRKMADYWDTLAKQNGFNGMSIIYRFEKDRNIPSSERCYYYEPLFSGWTGFMHKVYNKLRKVFKLKKIFKYSYDKIWKKILKNAKRNKNDNIFGCFVNYDDSPRRGYKGRCVIKGTPEKFHNYLKSLCEISEEKNKDYIFITAWNEWGEGAYLEPDTINNYSYLESIKKIKEEIK